MSRMRTLAQRSDGKKTGAVRLTISYEGDSLKLTKQQSLDMIPPPSDEFMHQKEASGFWVEMIDRERNVIYRRATENPIRHFAEVRSDDPDRPLAMHEVKDPSGIFTILIPDITEAVEVALFSSPLEEDKRLLPSVEIARFELRGGQKGREA